MLLPVTCEACGRTFKVDGKYAGRKGRCPNSDCRAVFVVPAATAPAEDGDDWLAALDRVVEEAAEDESPANAAGSGRPRGAKARSKASRQAEQSAGAGRASGRRAGRGGKGAGRSPSQRLWIIGASIAAVVALGALLPFVFRGGSKSGAPGGELLAKDQPDAPTFSTHGLPFLKKYCYECHSGDEPEAGILFTKFTDDRAVLKDRKLWARTVDLVQQGIMPPADSAQPTVEEKEKLVAYVDRALNYVDCSQGIDPGRVTIRRLNRTEYNNTVRDLVGVNFRPADDFPSDDVGYGFDNIGDVLSLPPLLMEKYLNAAETIAQQAIVITDGQRPKSQIYRPKQLQRRGAANDSGDTIALVSSGAVFVRFDAALSGTYKLRARASGQRAGNEPPRMEFSLDGQKRKTFDVNARGNRADDYEETVTLTKGSHEFAAAFINDFYDEKKKEDRNLFVAHLEIVGPLTIEAAELSALQRQLTASRPGADRTVNVAVRENLRPFVTRAFRRPVQEDELDGYVRLVEATLQQGEPFEAAMQRALMAVLVAPQFLFRIEVDRHPNDAKERHSLNDYELASRLSYFLWSSMPDDELFVLAQRNELHKEAVLEGQVRRMLKDPKATALVDNFAEQWLQLRILDEITPDPAKFPEYNARLRGDLQQETLRLFQHVMQDDLSLLTFLDARYTFVNERLAKHYGLPGVKGEEFQKVSLEGTQRAGIFTHGSILTLTSNPDRTSPVKRGKWIMEVVLNTPPPPPPPNAPDLTSAKAPPGATLRQQLEIHRANASCASCHRVMDDLGFGLENYDAIGRWRDQDGGQPLDTSGELPGGHKFRGSQELAQVLRQREEEFVRCLVEKLLTYALGRPLEYYDRCTQNMIFDQVKAKGYRFSALVHAITTCEAFRMRRGEEAAE